MRMKYFSVLFALVLLSFSFVAKAQEDLLKLVDTTNSKEFKNLPPTWKDVKLINVETTKILDPAVMQFVILHRFGNVGGEGTGGFHTLAGFDIASDIEFAFNFGITKNFMIGVSAANNRN